MSDLLAQLWTPQLQAALIGFTIVLVALYILSIVWTARDAYMRVDQWYLWTLPALVPFVGVVAYCLLRPPMMKVDHDEQELEIALKQRELMKYGECANCGYPVERDYIICPNCHTRLKNLCPTCHHALEPEWTVCPYCTTPIGNGAGQQQQRRRRAPQPRPESSSSRRAS